MKPSLIRVIDIQLELSEIFCSISQADLKSS